MSTVEHPSVSRPEHWVPQTAARSLPELFAARVARTPDEIAYRYFDAATRGWQSLTWIEQAALVARWRGAMQALQLAAGERVAILVRNSPDWVAIDQAALSLGLVVVGLFCRDTPAINAAILRDCAAQVLVTGKGRWWRALAETGDFAALTTVVALDDDESGNDACLTSVRDWLPAQGLPAPAAPDANDLAVIIYTSGTTGRARGVMLTHRNLSWNAYAGADAVPVPTDEQRVSFVPLSLAYERTVNYHHALITGGTISFCRQPRFLSATLANARPTVLVGVPKIYEHYYAELRRGVARRPRTIRRLVAFTINLGWSVFEREQGRGRARLRHLLWPLLRRFVAKPCLRPLGGRVEIAISGAAALPRPVARTLIGLGLPILQGYGLTEAAPVVSVNRADDNDPSGVGRLLADIEIRLGADNELWVRSPGVMRGYWRDPVATAAVLDATGWLRTGDKVSRLDQRRLYLTGRLKEVIVLATGDKASPEPLEDAITLDPLFAHAVVVGEARAYLAAVVSCEPTPLRAEMQTLDLDPDDPASLKAPRLEQRLLKRIAALLVDFPVHAQVHRVAVTMDAWTVENGMLTVSQKRRRRRIAQTYAADIQRVYGRRAAAEKTDSSYNVNVG